MRIPRLLRSKPVLTPVAILAVATLLGMGLNQPAGPAPSTVPVASGTARVQLTTSTNAGCNTAPRKGYARCMSVVQTPDNHVVTPDAAGPPVAALGPTDIQSAYRLPASRGGGQTVALVDAYGDSHAEADLAAYRAYYGLPACTTANGCFKKVDQRGGSNYPADDSGWGTETTLDLDAVSAACPACNILLVQADDPGMTNLGAAENTAVALGAKFVSNSYGADEDPSELANDTYYDHPGVVIAASSGDVGNVVEFPSDIGNVVAVGGTQLTKDASTSRGWTETAWGSGGSGCSTISPQPGFQAALNTGCSKRATADISADASPASGLAVYDTLGQGGWLQVGGTSLASPLVTAMYALAGPPAAGTYPVTYPYHDAKQAADLFDVTQGTNGSCGTVLCTAGPGWDGPTGLGTPDGVGAFTLGQQGDIVGQVTDATTGAPVTDAVVTASPGGYLTHVDATGHYDIGVGVGAYTVTASSYTYTAASKATDVAVGAHTTVDFGLQAKPQATVTGTVADGSGHGWPLFARITIDGYPGGPIYTDPFTGHYSVTLAGQSSYKVHVVPVYPGVVGTPADGYVQLDSDLTVGTGDSSKNYALTIDQNSCSAPGYGPSGLSETFAGAHDATPVDGWTTSGSPSGWRFDNPGNRSAVTPFEGRFAVADTAAARGRIDATLTSPAVDLSGQSAPHLSFLSGYYGAEGQSAQVGLSTDGGRTWTNVWQQTTANGAGTIDLPIPQAAGKKDVRVRFHFTGRPGGWWWSVGDVLVGTHTCTARPGGIVSGLITDHATGKPVQASIVTDTAAPGRYSVAGPTDEATVSGFYSLFLDAGRQRLNAATPGYATATATAAVAPNAITRLDWALNAAGGTR
ncbi:hypothetical protein KGQ19_36320 [Catenulispora sp. NL8]|uniref:Peptidase S53 domain-containing protein n=1 Tax=Catenulispora pinistramenti TaxID=2705254 RepID=A0ABS5L1X5_9ACTN|nr:S53 family peptidase [Catenulispora pinistramenti]MBS2552335.1 hypothetical protein [Catenulispora pinistramenti]